MSQVIADYFAAFNAGDVQGMLDCLSDDVAHHVNEGQVRRGKDAFAEFCAHMSRCYRETLTDIVIFEGQWGTRAAAEYIVNGTYLQTDDGLPQARGQSYRLTTKRPHRTSQNDTDGKDVADGKITRVTTYYNLADWMRQVS